MNFREWRVILGAIIYDAPLYCWYLCHHVWDSRSWIKIKNREDKLDTHPSSPGIDIDHQWTSDLYLPTVFPVFGRRLLRHALKSHKINFADTYNYVNKTPDISFIIGHRGSNRTPLLLGTLSSIAAQIGCNIECIVVEQDSKPQLASVLPAWVKHVFAPLPYNDMPYSRSMAFNTGAQHARAKYLIFHDNDLLVSEDYACQVLEKCSSGYDFVNLKRFIFYLSSASSRQVLECGDFQSKMEIEAIMQNAKGGGSIGASKAAFSSIGGFDERFVGWGAEDNEFWERAMTKNVWTYGFLPLVHLWHEAQAEKSNIETSSTKALYTELSKITPKERINALKVLSDNQHTEVL